MTTLIYPVGIKFEVWSAQIRTVLPQFNFPIPTPLSDWWGWASQVVSNNVQLQGKVPSPTQQGFPKEEDWKIWAAHFVESIYNFI